MSTTPFGRRLTAGLASAVLGLLALGPTMALADPPTYKTRCPSVRVGTKTVTVDVGYGRTRCRAAGNVLKAFVGTNPRVGRSQQVMSGGARWTCSRNADRGGAAWRYVCSARSATVLGGRLLANRLYQQER